MLSLLVNFFGVLYGKIVLFNKKAYVSRKKVYL